MEKPRDMMNDVIGDVANKCQSSCEREDCEESSHVTLVQRTTFYQSQDNIESKVAEARLASNDVMYSARLSEDIAHQHFQHLARGYTKRRQTPEDTM